MGNQQKVNFNVPMIGQANASICWLACYQMLYGYKKRSTSEPFSRASNAGLSTTSALYSEQWGTARDAMGLYSYRVSHLKESFANLTYILQKFGPMWCAGNFLFGSGHAIVITGFDPNSQLLRINDPYEIYKYYSYNYLTYDQWRSLVKELPFACQVWSS